MSENPGKFNLRKSRSLIALAIVSIVLACFLTYGGMLRYSFTGRDTLTLIETSRVASFGDAAKILTQPLMAGSKFVDEEGRFYRPIASLSYGLDHYVWGLNPLGYHLTDLMLHTFVALSVFVVMMVLTEGRRSIAWLSAMMFALHPILVESVPAIARRHDILATLFLMLSFLFFLSYATSDTPRRKWALLCSVISFALALGSKEVAILLPVIILSYLFAFSPRLAPYKEFTRSDLLRFLRICAPYLVVAALFLVWRGHVVGGLGGYKHASIFRMAVDAFITCQSYVLDLVYPVLLIGAVPASHSKAACVVILLLILLLVILRRGIVMTNLMAYGRTRAGRLARAGSAVVSAICFAVVAGYPIISCLVNKAVKNVYAGGDLTSLAQGVRSNLPNSLSHYLGKSQAFTSALRGIAVLGIIAMALVWTSRLQQGGLRRRITGSMVGRAVVFLMLWLLLPLCFFVAADTFDHRFMYAAAFPFCAILSLAVVESVLSVRSQFMTSFCGGNPFRPPIGVALTMVLSLGLLVYLLAFSPIVRDYRGWADNGKAASIVLQKLEKMFAGLPRNASVHIYNLPAGIAGHDVPSVKSVSCLGPYSIKSWLNLTDPGNRFSVVVESCNDWPEYPDCIDLETASGQNGQVAVTVVTSQSLPAGQRGQICP